MEDDTEGLIDDCERAGAQKRRDQLGNASREMGECTRQGEEIEFCESCMDREGELSEIPVFHCAKGRNEGVHFF